MGDIERKAAGNMARALTHSALATRLQGIAERPRTWPMAEREVLLLEAARRLREHRGAVSLSAEELHCLTCAMAGNFPERFAPIRMDLLRKLAKASRASGGQ